MLVKAQYSHYSGEIFIVNVYEDKEAKCNSH
jgi:hypothetical protein